MAPFAIFALPRSRTAWLSRFLTYRDVYCGHDETRHMRDLSDVRAWLSQDKTGTAETGSASWWRLAVKYRPDLRIAVVRRPVEEVAESLRPFLPGANLGTLVGKLKRMDAKLDQISYRIPNALSVTFRDLSREETCATLFEHCLPYSHDRAWWKSLEGVNIQCSMPGMLRYAEAYKSQLEKMSASATSAIKIQMAAKRRYDFDGIVIKREPFDLFLRDAESLFAEHLTHVGERPDAFKKKNLPMMRHLDRCGSLQVMTARNNGRMFGYIMTLISPSLETLETTTAIHTSIFASPDYPGLGMKLNRAAMQDLREQGVDEIFYRAGPRGSGPKMGACYRRLGAQPDGELYRLTLRDC